MLDNFPGVVKSENVDTCIIVAAGPYLVAMKYDKIALRDGPLEMGYFAGVITSHLFKIRDERLFTIRHMGIVLDVDSPGVSLNRLPGSAFVEHKIVESLCIGFVRFGVHCHHHHIFRLLQDQSVRSTAFSKL